MNPNLDFITPEFTKSWRMCIDTRRNLFDPILLFVSTRLGGGPAVLEQVYREHYNFLDYENTQLAYDLRTIKTFIESTNEDIVKKGQRNPASAILAGECDYEHLIALVKLDQVIAKPHKVTPTWRRIRNDASRGSTPLAFNSISSREVFRWFIQDRQWLVGDYSHEELTKLHEMCRYWPKNVPNQMPTDEQRIFNTKNRIERCLMLLNDSSPGISLLYKVWLDENRRADKSRNEDRASEQRTVDWIASENRRSRELQDSWRKVAEERLNHNE